MTVPIISVINLKGGSAKTSTIVNLGGVLHESWLKPILIDSDPQQSATRWAKQGGNKFPFAVIPIDIGKNVKQFKSKLDKLIKDHRADYVLFDTPPALADEALVSALLSDLVLIPITPSPLDIWACEQAILTIREARKERMGNLPKALIVPSRLMPRTLLSKELNDSLKCFNEPIAPSISMRVAMPEACIAGLPVHLYAPNSVSHKEFRGLMKFALANLEK